MFFLITNVSCTSALTALSPTFGIRALEVLQPAAGCHRKTTTFYFFFFLEEQRRKKTNKKLAFHCVKSQIKVSQPVVLCPCDCNHLKGTPCATTKLCASFGWSTFGRISWIRPSHRCSHPKQNRPKQSVLCNRYSIYNRKLTELTPNRQHSGRLAGSVPQVVMMTLTLWLERIWTHDLFLHMSNP